MRISLLPALIFTAAWCLLPAAAGGAQVYQITSLSGGIDALVRNIQYDSNGQDAGYSDSGYSQALAPANNYNVSAYSPIYSNAYGSLRAVLSDTAIGFNAVSTANGSSGPGGRVEVTSHYELTVHFTVNDDLLMQLTLDPYGAQHTVYYAQVSGDTSSYNNISLLQVAGVDETTLYTHNPDFGGLTVDTRDGINDGVFYFAMLHPGSEYVLSLDSTSNNGTILAAGSLKFIPVPEPSGALLLFLGLTLLSPRRRTRSA